MNRLHSRVDGASLAAFRALFGATMALATARFAGWGWIHELYVAPARRFPYPGFEWVPRPPSPWIYLLFAVSGIAAVGIALGWRTRAAAAVFFLTFTWIELIDQVNYLNHYVLVSLVAAALVMLPTDRALSVSARPGAPIDVPWLALAWLRFQFGAVYFFAGVAKLIPDWLLHAQPLRLWLERHAGVPVVGPWLAWDPTAYLMSWAGCAFDLAVPFALLHPRTRLPAWAVLVIFHIATGVLFQIGVFPFVMVVGSTLFFDPSWPRRWLTAPGASVDAVVPSTTPDDARVSPPAAPLPRAAFAVAAIAAAAQIAFPLRTFAYDHNHLWTEQGFRFSWRVLLMEKSGEVTFKVVDRVSGRTRWVDPARDLTPYQAQMMATQPDMVLRYASWIAREEQAIGRDVAIYADSWASLNGRPAQRLIDPDVDLTRVTDDLGPRVWVTSFRDGAPP